MTTTNVLILCTHNSARSVLAEGMLNHLAHQHQRPIRAYSAGSTPSGRINPFALNSLHAAGVDTSGFRSKNWDEFAAPDSPEMRIVITVCDSAAQETCPYWPGGPVKLHWGYPDPSNTLGGDEAKAAAFDVTRQALAYRMLQLVALPFDEMDNKTFHAALLRIGAS